MLGIERLGRVMEKEPDVDGMPGLVERVMRTATDFSGQSLADDTVVIALRAVEQEPEPPPEDA